MSQYVNTALMLFFHISIKYHKERAHWLWWQNGFPSDAIDKNQYLLHRNYIKYQKNENNWQSIIVSEKYMAFGKVVCYK